MFGVTAPIDGSQRAMPTVAPSVSVWAVQRPCVPGRKLAWLTVVPPSKIPGVRNMSGRQVFLAYLRDPDGNKLCAVHVMS